MKKILLHTYSKQIIFWFFESFFSPILSLQNIVVTSYNNVLRLSLKKNKFFKLSKNLSVLSILLLSSILAQAQNLDKIGKKDMVKVSGGFNLNTITYASNGTSYAGRDPFTWFASGNLNVSILDVSLPFTYTYSNRVGKYTQPYNQVAFHPKYKWVQGHFGITSMSFSPYTLSGHTFAGGGLDLTKGKFKVSLMGGRLNKEVVYDPILNNQNEITYKRFGYGLKAVFTEKKYSVNVIMFKASDQANSLSQIPLNTTIQPQDNLVMSIGGKTTLVKNLTLDGEFALSGLTKSTLDLNPYEGTQSAGAMNSFINGNSTTDFYNAYKTSLSYQLKIASLSFNFEHIDPNYKTLGGYYFNNDIENYTLAPSIKLLKGKMNLGINAGFQKNNLAEDKTATTKRWIGSTNLSYTPIPKVSVNGSYSNFSTYTRNRPTTDPFYYQIADTLNFYQLSQNASASLMLQMGKKDANRRGSMQVLYNFQESSSMNGNIQNANAFGYNVGVEGIPSYVHSGNLAYTSSFKKEKMGITLASNVNQTEFLDQKSLFIGPSLTLQKKLKEKINLSGGSTYNRQYKNETLVSNVFNTRISVSYAVKMKREEKGKKKLGSLNLSLNGNWMTKLPTVNTETKFNELNIFANLGYKF